MVHLPVALPSSSDQWGADLDLLNLPCMPSGRHEFFHRVRRLNRESWRWTPAQKRAFNKIWSYLEQRELHQSQAHTTERGGNS
jgi:hypothetical protein